MSLSNYLGIPNSVCSAQRSGRSATIYTCSFPLQTLVNASLSCACLLSRLLRRLSTLHHPASVLIELPPIVVLLLFPLLGPFLLLSFTPSVAYASEPLLPCSVFFFPRCMAVHARVHCEALAAARPCYTEGTAGGTVCEVWESVSVCG